MARIQRILQKIFGGNAPTDDIAVLGSFKTGTPVYTDNIAALQNNAYEEGYGAALVANEAPFMEEQNSIPYILSKQLAYIFQEGIAEYDEETTYFTGSWVKGVVNNKRSIFESLTDENTGNPLTDATNWQEISFGGGSGTSLPLFTPILSDHILEGDEAVGLALQGSLITMTYPKAVNAVKTAYASGTEQTFTYGDITFSYTLAANKWQIADISQKDYVDQLFAQTGVAKFYVLDSENDRFYLPRESWFPQFTTDPDKVNKYNEAGLPNITGLSSGNWGEVGTQTGAFTAHAAGGNRSAGQSASNKVIEFDASRSNPIYGNSDTVQPSSSNWFVYYVVGNTVTNESEIDVGNVLSDLQLKADVNLSNAQPSAYFKKMSTGWGIPDYTAGVSKIWNTLYTAETAGVVYVASKAQANAYITINGEQIHFNGNGNTVGCLFPVAQGDTYRGTGGESQTIKFYPLKGVKQ